MADKRDIKTVLVVDDDAEYLNFLCIAIGTVYRVFFVNNGEAALPIARAKKPDVILLDVLMPDGDDGFTTFVALRNDPVTSHIPVIMLSSVGRITGLPFGRQNMEDYLGSAPAAFLEKPITPERLLSELRRALGEESSGREGSPARKKRA